MSGVETVGAIVEILVAGIQNLGAGIASGVANFAQALAFTGEGENQELSVYFVLVIVFAGVALAIGLTRRVFAMLGSMGGQK